MFLFNKREVFIGTSYETASRIKNVLAANLIPYQTKIISHQSSWTGRGAIRSFTGSAGTNLGLCQQIIIYVHKQDFERSLYVIQSEK